MGNVTKHIEIAKEKLQGTIAAYNNKQNTIKNYPKEINDAMRKVWFAYGDLGYDGVNGKEAKIVMENLKKVVKFFEKRLNLKLWHE